MRYSTYFPTFPLFSRPTLPAGKALVSKSKALAYLASRGELTEAARSAFNLIRGKVEGKVEADTELSSAVRQGEKTVRRGAKPRVGQGWVEMENEEIRAGLREAGWREDPDLVPAGWMFRQRPGLATVQFISQQGRQFHSVKEANTFLASNKVDFLIRGSLCQAAVVDNYELELKKIERRTNLGKSAPPALPSLPAGISLSRLDSSAPTRELPLSKHSQEFRFSLENFKTDNTSISISEFQNVFKQLETFKRKNCDVGENKRFKYSYDEIDSL